MVLKLDAWNDYMKANTIDLYETISDYGRKKAVSTEK